MVVSRALTSQIDTFLVAARRLARGDFRQPVPVEGHDEFAQLGREFNSMSEQLASKIEEVQRQRGELTEAIRRVGDALAMGLDRNGVVALAVRTAVDACEAEAGRARPVDEDAFRESSLGATTIELQEALEAAERRAAGVRLIGPKRVHPSETASRAPAARGHARERGLRARAGRADARAARLVADGVPRRRSRSPAASAGSPTRRRSCSSTSPARPSSRSRTRPARDRRAPGGHRRADRAGQPARLPLDPRPRDRARAALRARRWRS